MCITYGLHSFNTQSKDLPPNASCPTQSTSTNVSNNPSGMCETCVIVVIVINIKNVYFSV